MENKLVEKTEEKFLKDINKPSLDEILFPIIGGIKYICRTHREMKKKGLSEVDGFKYDRSLWLGSVHGVQMLIAYTLYRIFVN